jgi:hypothetical protein
MKKTEEKSSRSAEGLYKFFIYFVLILLAVTIIVPVAWVFMASIKQNSEFYGNPWALPAGFYWQNFVNAWNGAKMGEYMLNSVLVTALALVLLLVIAGRVVFAIDSEGLVSAIRIDDGKRIWKKKLTPQEDSQRDVSMKGAGVAVSLAQKRVFATFWMSPAPPLGMSTSTY